MSTESANSAEVAAGTPIFADLEPGNRYHEELVHLWQRDVLVAEWDAPSEETRWRLTDHGLELLEADELSELAWTLRDELNRMEISAVRYFGGNQNVE